MFSKFLSYLWHLQTWCSWSIYGEVVTLGFLSFDCHLVAGGHQGRLLPQRKVLFLLCMVLAAY